MITEVISTDYSYYVTVPPEAVTEEVYLTALVLGDFTYQSFSAAMLNENTQVAQPEVYTFVYESYETEEPIQTSYVIDYTSYVEVPAELKETVFTYTEYVTDRPSLVQFTEIFTVYVTKAMAVEQAEVTFSDLFPIRASLASDEPRKQQNFKVPVLEFELLSEWPRSTLRLVIDHTKPTTRVDELTGRDFHDSLPSREWADPGPPSPTGRGKWFSG
ncbi:hypothetical protein CSKR_100904 [Clonorchis sinensis]|uniref:Uncharacterized protein n=1 Tax=Clonorchis sinensis TaxID=79923 RepID=A0A8T1MGZ1_CLOSI|nr:hypothetical protein CSKR_100904 [Clonorchis sinensis]